jgi:hypothetical protein
MRVYQARRTEQNNDQQDMKQAANEEPTVIPSSVLEDGNTDNSEHNQNNEGTTTNDTARTPNNEGQPRQSISTVLRLLEDGTEINDHAGSIQARIARIKAVLLPQADTIRVPLTLSLVEQVAKLGSIVGPIDMD